MGVQNRPYNKQSEQFQKTSVIPHGSIYCDVPSALHSKDGLEKLCETVVAEGFVVINEETNERYKLKRENFPDVSDPSKGDQKGPHKRAPSEKNGEYTDTGLTLCGGNGFGYCSAALGMITNTLTSDVAIAKFVIDGHDVIIYARPIKSVIEKQLKMPFDGHKMLNLYQMEGQGQTYRYTDELADPSIVDGSVEFQLKFDGETALVHKDAKGRVHLMIKLQVDVYEIEKEDGSLDYRFGWI